MKQQVDVKNKNKPKKPDKICPNCGEKYNYYKRKCPNCKIRVLDLTWLDFEDRDPILLKFNRKSNNHIIEISQLVQIDPSMRTTHDNIIARGGPGNAPLYDYGYNENIITSLDFRVIPDSNGNLMYIKDKGEKI